MRVELSQRGPLCFLSSLPALSKWRGSASLADVVGIGGGGGGAVLVKTLMLVSPSEFLDSGSGLGLGSHFLKSSQGFSDDPVLKKSPCNTRNTGLTPGLWESHMPWSCGPLHHNYWASALEPEIHNYRSQIVYSLCSTRETTTWEVCSPSLCNQRKPESRSEDLHSQK